MFLNFTLVTMLCGLGQARLPVSTPHRLLDKVSVAVETRRCERVVSDVEWRH